MHTQPAVSTQGLLYSLAAELPAGNTLARRARAVAARLSRRGHPRALEDRAASLLAQLLTATDCVELAGYETEGCLDPDWDA